MSSGEPWSSLVLTLLAREHIYSGACAAAPEFLKYMHPKNRSFVTMKNSYQI